LLVLVFVGQRHFAAHAATALRSKQSEGGSLIEIFCKVILCRRGGCLGHKKLGFGGTTISKTDHRNGTRMVHVTSAAPCHTRTAGQPNSPMIFCKVAITTRSTLARDGQGRLQDDGPALYIAA
jgi:hypothetical protein